jgi:hypothetical protein
LKAFVLILLGLPLVVAAQSSLTLKGVLLDSSFQESDSVKVEVLESGSSTNTKYNESFELLLTDDKTWNVCVSDINNEQCYIVNREGTDSLINASFNNDNQLEVFSSFMDEKKERELLKAKQVVEEAKNVEAQDNTQEVAKQTRLRKLVVTVKKRPKRSLGQSTVSAKNIKRMPGLAEADVVKAIQALPGVVASSDFSSKIYVRGGGADQNLFLFDNGVVYSPVHFFGLFSTFLVEGIDKVDFYKGGFSPEFGNRLSSVVDITSRPGGNDADSMSWAGSAQISTFASTLNLEGSANATQLNFSGRATYLKEVLAGLRAIGATDVDLDYRFYDLQGSWHQKINDNQSFSLSAYGGEDKLIFTPIEVYWGNTVIPFNYYWDINSHWFFQGSYAFSNFNQGFGLENIQGFENVIESYDAKAHFEYRGFDDQTWKFGLQDQVVYTKFRNESKIANIDQIDDDWFVLTSPYVEQVYNLDNFQFKSGLRATHTSALNKVYFEPRFSARWNIGEFDKIDFHVGHYEQFVNSILFGDFETINEFYYPSVKTKYNEVPPANSQLFSLGYSTERVENFEFILEGYYKSLNNLIVFAPDQAPDSIAQNPDAGIGDLLFQGEGYSLGAEVSVRMKEGIVSGGMSYSYSYSVMKEFDEVIPAKWDMPHAFKLDAAINWRDPKENAFWINPKEPYFRQSLQIKYSSGLPYSGVIGYRETHLLDQTTDGTPAGGPNPSYDGNVSTPYGSRNGNRYPDYFRFDLKIVDWGRENKWNLSWTWLNITDNENVFSYAYDTTTNPPEKSTISQFPFFPMLINYQYYF